MPLSSTSLVVEQAFLFLEALVLGGGIGFFYDIYRGIRFQTRSRLSLTTSLTGDLFYWLIVTILSIYLFMVRRWGEVHIYTYYGMGSGFILYFYFLSKPIFLLWSNIFRFLLGLCSSLYKCTEGLCRSIVAPLLSSNRRNNK